MTALARFSVVTLGVRDFARMRDCYRALGWAESAHATEDWTAFATAGTRLSLYAIDRLMNESGLAHRAGSEDGFAPASLAVHVECPEAVDAAYGAMLAAGGRSLAEPAARAGGGRSARVADPEGNACEITFAPNAARDAAGPAAHR